MDDELVTARVFTYDHEAQLFAAKLESEGIECFMDDNFITSANPFLSNAVGGIKVNIRISDVERAKEIINEIETPERKNHIDGKPITVNKEHFVPVESFCPICNSERTYQLKYNWFKLLWAYVAVLFIRLPPPIKGKMHCAECKHDWEVQ